MKAFLLAAGYGTRLRPITDTIPKCLVPICGKPLLGWWLELLRRHGVTDVLINTHYLREPVQQFIADYNNRCSGITAHEFYEPDLLGSGGTVRANQAFVAEEESFLICYADNLTDANLTAFQDFHAAHNGVLSIGLFHTNLPEQCGIATLGEHSCITAFEEKPPHPTSNLANAGMYIARQELFRCLPQQEVLDFGKDVLPQLVGHMYGWQTSGYLLDIGTMGNYKKANMEWKK